MGRISKWTLLSGVLGLQSCASPPTPPPYIEPPQPAPIYEPPPVRVSPPIDKRSDPGACYRDFSIAMRTEEYVIVDHKVLDNSPQMGKIRFSGKYAFVPPYVLFKFKAANCPNSYWIGKIETTRQGVLETRAERRDEPSYELRPVSPPCMVEVGTKIVDGRFQQSFIKNPHPGWGPFLVERYQKPILTFSNWHYPGCKWDAKVPMSDGEGVIKMVFQSGTCESAELVCRN